MKKLWISILVGLMVFPVLFGVPARAATPIKVIIDGTALSMDQPPVMVNGRTMVPLRAIFEAFNARILWDQKTQTVTATKDSTTIVLKIGSKNASINNKSVTLDVPGLNLKGRTMVPTRFVSEALGREVGWNQTTKVVTITSPAVDNGNTSSTPVTGVTGQDVSDYGDGRDLQVSFVRGGNEALVDQYRVFIVKTGYGLNLSSVQTIAAANYTALPVTGANPSFTLTSGSRTMDGDTIKNDQGYTVYVLTIGKGNNANVLSSSSSTVTLVNKTAAILGTIQVNDTNDYNDGRDVLVSFNKLADESKTSSYRVFAVKTANYTSFNLAAANAVPAANYTVISKTGSNISQVLSSGARDTDGALIRNGISYRVFVMAVNSSNTANSLLSAASSVLTLSTAGISNLSVSDVNDYNDGRDLRVSFTHAADESYISQYRIMVVPTSYYSSFSVSEANNVASAYYSAVGTSGSSTSLVLSSSTRDVRGSLIKNGINYRVYVLSVGSGSNSGSNILSPASAEIMLWNDYSLSAVTNLAVSDVNDYNDGRDLKVAFNHAADETYVSQYRIMVVPTSYYSSFSLSDANSVSSGNYTSIGTSGSVTSQVLASTTRDVRGSLIKNGVSYRVYVVSIGSGTYSGTNVLSASSAVITLLNGTSVTAVTDLSVSDVDDYSDGRDLRVAFTHAPDETYITQYRILIVPTSYYSSFSLADAINTPYYTVASTSGNSTSQVLDASAKDVRGAAIKDGVGYKVYVLSAADSNYSGPSVLSGASSAITLAGRAPVVSVTNVTYGVSNNVIRVSFTRSSNENNISEYRVLIVPAKQGFGLSDALGVQSSSYNAAAPNGADLTIAAAARDVNGNAISSGVKYKAYILAVSKGSGSQTGGLSDSTEDFEY
ncbi:copper amine oxidase N-terminal domain-containing protein [Paenibacillus sp. MMS20-IR301]|uniref:copper amine oxidase N-terminal domain-containing protein n=1 Tax=Paenibacillus sp. MMS20-IR301 TaxID=2895946 RepID=UPI0028ED06F3|nr:copper amine oxidase N-terminal domain-containing protein [Paenibacillus sp. MMS20-IR301]WNS46471.1 copper amine oxidase N-terminal domain-containing protein [Paenibacillus sp. MMS20-IR301]